MDAVTHLLSVICSLLSNVCYQINYYYYYYYLFSDVSRVQSVVEGSLGRFVGLPRLYKVNSDPHVYANYLQRLH